MNRAQSGGNMSAARLASLRQNGSDIAGFPLDSAALPSVAAPGD
jgi:hypothetical protein